MQMIIQYHLKNDWLIDFNGTLAHLRSFYAYINYIHDTSIFVVLCVERDFLNMVILNKYYF